jgi:hypothetical protein
LRGIAERALPDVPAAAALPLWVVRDSMTRLVRDRSRIRSFNSS